MEKQKTIAKEVNIKGVGLHTGNPVNVTFKPAPANSGINFVRRDLENSPTIKAEFSNILDPSKSPRRTSLTKDGIEVHTVEHLMAVLSGLGIDNIIVEIDNNEIPGLDGSGKNFLEVLKQAGIKEEIQERNYFSLKEPIWLEEEDTLIAAFPSGDYHLSYTLDYDHPQLRCQYMDFNLTPQSFEKDVAYARTFCLEEEANGLVKQGLGKGANYENTLVVGKRGVIKNKLRFEDEFIRHKLLDLIGDLYTLGFSIRAHVVAVKSGHPLNIKLLKKIQAQKERYALGGIGAGPYPEKYDVLDRDAIMKILPHRDPFLFVDKILSLEPLKRAVGVKNLTKDDYFFKGHFPGRPVMPGVLIIEAMAQVGGILMLSPQENRGKLAFFLSVNNAKFRRTVLPGDSLIMEVEAGKLRSKTGQVKAKAYVDGKLVAEADLMFALVEE